MKDRSSVIAFGFVGVQLLLLAAIFLLPGGNDWVAPSWLFTYAGAMQIVGAILLGAGMLALGRSLTALPLPTARSELKTNGIYRFVRHPIYSGLIALTAGGAIRSSSLEIAAATISLIVWLAIKARWEEARLRERYPEYEAYAAATPGFIPFFLRADRLRP